MKKLILFMVICVGFPFLLLKCMGTANSAQSITVSNIFANPTMGGLSTGVVFLDIQNTGVIPDAVAEVETPVAARAEIHETIDDNGVMRMRKVDALVLLPRQMVKLQPGGMHIMLFELKQPLKLHQRFPLTLKMKTGLKVPLMVRVEERK